MNTDVRQFVGRAVDGTCERLFGCIWIAVFLFKIFRITSSIITMKLLWSILKLYAIDLKPGPTVVSIYWRIFNISSYRALCHCSKHKLWFYIIQATSTPHHRCLSAKVRKPSDKSQLIGQNLFSPEKRYIHHFLLLNYSNALHSCSWWQKIKKII